MQLKARKSQEKLLSNISLLCLILWFNILLLFLVIKKIMCLSSYTTQHLFSWTTQHFYKQATQHLHSETIKCLLSWATQHFSIGLLTISFLSSQNLPSGTTLVCISPARLFSTSPPQQPSTLLQFTEHLSHEILTTSPSGQIYIVCFPFKLTKGFFATTYQYILQCQQQLPWIVRMLCQEQDCLSLSPLVPWVLMPSQQKPLAMLSQAKTFKDIKQSVVWNQ